MERFIICCQNLLKLRQYRIGKTLWVTSSKRKKKANNILYPVYICIMSNNKYKSMKSIYVIWNHLFLFSQAMTHVQNIEDRLKGILKNTSKQGGPSKPKSVALSIEGHVNHLINVNRKSIYWKRKQLFITELPIY